jgi:hypothetical protein
MRRALPGPRPLPPGNPHCDADDMKSWFAEPSYPAPGTTDDELPGTGRPIPVAGRACCCPAAPVVTVIMPPSAARRHPVDLLLCGHHYRVSQAALLAAGATVYDAAGTLIMPGAGRQPASSRQPAPAGRHPVAS